MKTLVAVLLLLAVTCEAQITEQESRSSTDSGYVTTAWKKINFSGSYVKIVRLDIDHDTSGYGRTPLLQYAFENDTTNKYVAFLRPGESMRHDGLGLLHVYIRASSGTVPYRVTIHR